MVMLAAVITPLGRLECLFFFLAGSQCNSLTLRTIPPFSMRGLFDLGKTTECLKPLQFMERHSFGKKTNLFLTSLLSSVHVQYCKKKSFLLSSFYLLLLYRSFKEAHLLLQMKSQPKAGSKALDSLTFGSFPELLFYYLFVALIRAWIIT